MNEESTELAGCLLLVAVMLLVIAVSVVVGHFFGPAFGFAVWGLLTAAGTLYVAVGVARGGE